MRDAKERDAVTQKDEDEKLLGKRQSEATSGETLSDVAEDEKVSGSTGGQPDPVASPDGQFDGTDEITGAGPMSNSLHINLCLDNDLSRSTKAASYE